MASNGEIKEVGKSGPLQGSRATVIFDRLWRSHTTSARNRASNAINRSYRELD